MSLVCWLPLNGDLTQQGASEMSITNNGAMVNNNGKIGKCYLFDGTNDYMSGTYTATQEISFCCWVNFPSIKSAHLFDARTSGGTGYQPMYITASTIQIGASGSNFTNFSYTWTTNTWYHICVTHNNIEGKCYVNGTLIGTSTAAKGANMGNCTFTLGSRCNQSNYQNAKMNDVRIYNHCLSAAEVREISQGLVLHYKLDNISNGIQDSSGYNHNGTTLNTVTTSTDTLRYTLSTSLPNGNSMINCGRGGMVTDSITVNMWIKSSAWANPVSCTEGGGWNFESSDTCFRFPVYISGVGYKYGKSTTTRTQICNNEWHMLTGVYDRINQKIQIYVDGQLDNDYATGTSNNIGYHGSNCIWIGAEATGSNTTASNGMAGLFSDFRIYCTALDADAVRQLYELGAKIDNKQNLHTFELIENQSSIKVTKRGQVKCDDLTESTTTKFYKSKDINTNNLIEL